MSVEPSALVLLSGGIDSTVLLHYVLKVLEYSKVETILFYYGQKHQIELEYAQQMVDGLGVPSRIIKVDFKQFDSSSMVVPGRNSVFLSLAVSYAETRGLQDIFIGSNHADFKYFPDCREQFIQLMSQALSMGNNIRGVYAPFIHKSKQEIVEIGRLLDVSFNETWSCYSPVKSRGELGGIGEVKENYVACGKCHACIERDGVLL